MQPMTILVDDQPRCVVRPNDLKGLQRLIRNAKPWLTVQAPDGKTSFREADEAEAARWRDARGLHLAAGGAEEEFIGVPL